MFLSRSLMFSNYPTTVLVTCLMSFSDPTNNILEMCPLIIPLVMFLKRSPIFSNIPTTDVLETFLNVVQISYKQSSCNGSARSVSSKSGLSRQMASRTAQRNRQLFFNNSETRGRLRQGRNFMYWLFDLNLNIWISIFFCSLFCFTIRFFSLSIIFKNTVYGYFRKLSCKSFNLFFYFL